MMCFGHQFPKRTLLWSTSWAVKELGFKSILSTVRAAAKQKSNRKKCAKKYINGWGETAYTATSALKGTQTLVFFQSFAWLIKDSALFLRKGDCQLTPTKLREYTPRFAGSVVRLIPALHASKPQMPAATWHTGREAFTCYCFQMAKVDTSMSLPHAFAAMQCTDNLDDVGIGEVIDYLKHCRYLRVPDAFVGYLPGVA